MKKLLIVFVMMLNVSLYAKQYYVSNTGNDNNDGLTPQTSWKTINKVNSEINNFVAGDVIAFKGGDEFYGTLTLTHVDGVSGNPITFTSYGTGKATIKGSESITGWTKTSANVWEADVTGKTIYNVFKNNLPLNNTRMPLPDMYYISEGSRGTTLISDDIVGLPDIVGATVYTGINQWTMVDDKVTAFNSGTGTITLATGKGIDVGEGFTIHNHKNLLANQDDWAYDSAANRIYMYSITSPIDITATSLINHTIQISRSNYLIFDNLEIRDAGNYGVKFTTSTNLIFSNNLIANCKERGISSGGDYDSSSFITVTHNTISNSDYYGIRIDGINATIEDNIVSNIGMNEYRTWTSSGYCVGIRSGGDNNTATSGNDSTIKRNTVNNTAYTGINFVGERTIISENYITNYAVYLPDGGAIYTFNPTWAETRGAFSEIKNNTVINPISPRFRIAIGSIYMDDQTEDITIDGNNVQGGKRGIFLHNNTGTIVTNNTIYGTFESGIGITEDANGGDGNTINNVVTGNTIYIEEAFGNTSTNMGQFGACISVRSSYNNTDLASFDNNKYYSPGNYIHHLVNSSSISFINSQFFKEMDLKDFQELTGEDVNSIANDFYYDSFSVLSLDSDNYMLNSDFSSVASDWAASNGSLTNPDGYLELVPTSSNSFAYSNPSSFAMKNGSTYLVEFDIKGDAKYELRFVLAMTGSPYKGTNHSITVTPDWRHYKFYLTSSFTGTNVRPEFHTQSMNEMHLDNFEIHEVTLGSKPINSHFAYNENKTAKNISLPGGIWEDLEGNSYSGSMNLQPYTSEILILSENQTGSVIANAGEDVAICGGESVTLTASGGSRYSWNTGATTKSITVSPNTTQTYTVSVSDGNSSATDEVIVTVNDVKANAGTDVSIIDGESITLIANGGDSYLWSNGETSQSITVSPNTTQTYEVTATKNDCKDTDSVKVTVNPLTGTVIANAGSDVSICSGESTTLTASGGSSYSWSTGATTKSITVSPSTTQTYMVTVSDGSSSDTDDVIVTVNNVTADVGSNKTIEEGDSITLTASGGDSYQWNTGETTESIAVSPNTTTTYSITVTKGNCEDTDEVTVTVNPKQQTAVTANAGEDQSICLGESITLTASGGSTYKWNTGETNKSITVDPNTTTTYTVIVSEGSASDTDDVKVTVNSVTADAGSNKTINEGESITLTASGGDSYNWSTGATTQSITVSPAKTKIYSVSVTKNGCEDTDNVQVTVNQNQPSNPPPANAYAGEDVTICLGKSVTLTASGGDSYLWSTGETGESINVIPQRTTTYTLSATRGGVTNSDNVTVIVENCSEIEEENKNNELSVYPNPSTGIIHVHAKSKDDNLNMDVVNLNGSIIHSEELRVKNDIVNKKLDLSRYTKGIYIVKLYNSTFNETKKVLIY